MATLPNPLYKCALLKPNKTALVFEEQRISFQELHELVVKRAHTLKNWGVQKEDHIGIYMSSSPQFVITYYALLYVGAAAVLFNTRLTKEELKIQEELGDVSFTIVEDSLTGIFINEKQLPETECADAYFEKEFSLDQVCTILFTSGTTGRPKAVQLTFGNHYFSAMSSAINIGIQEDDCYLAVMPLFHIGGLSIFHRSFMYGMKVVLMRKFNPDEAVIKLQKEKVNQASFVTKMLNDLMKNKAFSMYACKMKMILLGGGSVPQSLLEQCIEKEIPILQTYGMTETSSQIVTLSYNDIVRKAGSCGKALATTSLRIEKEGVICRPYEEGEIVVKGPNITIGYYNNVAANKDSFKDGWFYTGDIGFLDEDGYLYVIDRRKDLIISGGENIYPSEIEHVLLSHSAVNEAGVTGKEDETWGQVPIAYIVRNEEVTAEELYQYCTKRLAKYKLPKEIHFVKELPRTASQKLQRHKLFELSKVQA